MKRCYLKLVTVAMAIAAFYTSMSFFSLGVKYSSFSPPHENAAPRPGLLSMWKHLDAACSARGPSAAVEGLKGRSGGGGAEVRQSVPRV